MIGRQAVAVAAALALGSVPAFGQGNPPAQAGQAEHMDMADMVCTMGMLPHGGMGGGMMMGGGMQQGAQGGGMQHNMPGMQQGAQAGGMQHNMPGMQHGATMGGMQPSAAGEAMGEMSHPVTPTMLIHHAQELGLTADQQAKVTELAKTSQASCEEHMKAAQASHQAAAAQLEKATPDVDGYEQGMKEAAEHLIEGHVAVVKAGVAAEALLTPEQRQKLTAAARTMHGGK